MSNNAYVYSIVVDGVVRYIGKGSGVPLKRAKQHLRDARRLLKQRSEGASIFAVRADHELSRAIANRSDIQLAVLVTGLDHGAAFEMEKLAISNAPSGQLWNIAGGGDGAGIVSESTRMKLSAIARERVSRPGFKDQCRKGWVNTPEEAKRRFIENSQAARLRPGFTEENKARAKANWADPIKAEAMRSALDRGRRAPHTRERHVKAWSPERKQKHSQRMRELWADSSFRSKQTELLRKATAKP